MSLLYSSALSVLAGARVAPAAPVAAFAGSRALAADLAPVVADLVASLAASGFEIATGCARGADAFVRAACPAAHVVRAASFGRGVGALVARSVAMVRLAASRPGSLLVAFVDRPCPAGLAPSPRPHDCFAGFGSGTWATIALAAGLGLPVLAVWCSPEPPAWPAWQACRPVGAGPLAVSARPAVLLLPAQIALF